MSTSLISTGVQFPDGTVQTTSAVGRSGVRGGSAIDTWTLTSGGSGYTDGSYTSVSLTGGSGNDAVANITVASGIVTVVSFTADGHDYVSGDVLSSDALGAGTGFKITVNTVTAQNNTFFENENAITTDYTVRSNYNAMSIGNISINSGVTVTVPSGSRWVIL